MSVGYLLTLDAGTTSIKTCVFGEDFSLFGYSCKEYELLMPENGIVELNPETYWEAARSGIREAVEASGIDAMQIAVVTVATQGETIIPVDESGRPLRNAMVWLDARAAEEASFIASRISGEEFYRTTGVPEINPAWPVCKVLWIKDREPEIYRKTYKFLLLEDFFLLKLTGRFVTEKCLMSSTGYYDINHQVLWEKMLSITGTDSGKFPEILDCGVSAGGILMDVADDLGVNPGIIVATGAMDQVASAIGAGNIAGGIVTETTGTALVIAATADTPDFGNPARLNIMRHGVKGKYLILPYNPTAGIILKWFRDEFCQPEVKQAAAAGTSIYRVLDDLAGGVSALSNGLLLLPYFAGMLIPEMNPDVKGVFFGVGLDTKKPHFIRSILEGIAFMLRQNIELLETMCPRIKEVRSLGGGSKSGLWSQIKADINNRTIHVMEQEESTSLGAAILGSLAAGMYGTVEEACRVVKIKNSYEPDPGIVGAYEKGYLKYQKLYASLKSLFL